MYNVKRLHKSSVVCLLAIHDLRKYYNLFRIISNINVSKTLQNQPG